MAATKLFIDTKIEEFEAAHREFEEESKQFFIFKQNLTRWDCFAKSEMLLKKLHKRVVSID